MDFCIFTIVGNAKHLKYSSCVSICYTAHGNKEQNSCSKSLEKQRETPSHRLGPGEARSLWYVRTSAPIICICPRGMRLTAVGKLKILRLGKQLGYTGGDAVKTCDHAITYFKLQSVPTACAIL